jgi:hypothetical protein
MPPYYVPPTSSTNTPTQYSDQDNNTVPTDSILRDIINDIIQKGPDDRIPQIKGEPVRRSGGGGGSFMHIDPMSTMFWYNDLFMFN